STIMNENETRDVAGDGVKDWPGRRAGRRDPRGIARDVIALSVATVVSIALTAGFLWRTGAAHPVSAGQLAATGVAAGPTGGPASDPAPQALVLADTNPPAPSTGN